MYYFEKASTGVGIMSLIEEKVWTSDAFQYFQSYFHLYKTCLLRFQFFLSTSCSSNPFKNDELQINVFSFVDVSAFTSFED